MNAAWEALQVTGVRNGREMNTSMVSLFLIAHLGAIPALSIDLPLEELLTPHEYRTYVENPKYRKRLNIYRACISRNASALRNYVRKRQIRETREFLDNIRALTRYVLEEPSRAQASSKDFRSNEAKKLEIRLRHLLNSLHDYQMAVPFEHRGEFEAAARDVGELRDQLLGQLFN